MTNVPTIMWSGKSGKEYQYWIYPIGSSFRESAGNYIFAKETRPGYWSPCYIGQTVNLNQRLGDHEKEACSRRNGATHIHDHTTEGGDATRQVEEKDLILRWQPPCNDQYVR